ncbi:MAG: transposase [Candidatus Gracilibacteria bacterium]|nr:transposase [Candidatus Gracilibacteria bacterium]
MMMKYRGGSCRLNGWDYAAEGKYFVTICINNRKKSFGKLVDAEVKLSQVGEIADKFWRDIPNHYNNVWLGAFIMMPDHMHGIVCIKKSINTFRTLCRRAIYRASNGGGGFTGKHNPMHSCHSLGKIIRDYKSAVSRWAHQNGFAEFEWQPRFYDHVIRDVSDLERISNYIKNNPLLHYLKQKGSYW